MKRRTKIVCTLGPAVDSKEAIQSLIEAGMNVARLNCSHGDWETKKRWIEWIRELSDDLAPIAVMADLQGPKFRVDKMTGDGVELVGGTTVTFGPNKVVPVSQKEILSACTPNTRVLLGDGEIELKITHAIEDGWDAKVIHGGLLKSRKGITLVGKVFDVPSLTEQDLADIRHAVDCEVDYIALSYVRSASDMRGLRYVVQSLDPKIALCAKIETREAIKDLDNILKVTDLIMVARGDLGLQMEIEDVPIMQKRVIDACNLAGRPVITATQMLESMIINSRPTRAEATDVANAVLDGTDALMLSGETAAGSYPIECVKTMVRIAEVAETKFDRELVQKAFREQSKNGVSQTDAIAHAVSDLAKQLRPKAIVTTTTSGQTPRLVSKFRPKCPIYCASWCERTHRQMAVVWGVTAIKIEGPNDTEKNLHIAIDTLFRKKRLKLGDQVILTAGVPSGVAGNTNLIMTQIVK